MRSTYRIARRSFWIGLTTLALASGAFAQASFSHAQDKDTGAVYAMTNAATGNSILIFARLADGTLASPAISVATGGAGLGSTLGSQGSLILSPDARWLLAVNAGSNTVTVFSVSNTGLQAMSQTGSGGTTPTSIAIFGNVVYVLNAGVPGTVVPNVAGFLLNTTNGSLNPIPGATQTLTGAIVPAQVAFAPDGRFLVVTDIPTNQIFTLRMNKDGVAADPESHPSNGPNPFGFAFGTPDRLIVSEANGTPAGPTGISSLSSYDATPNGDLRVITRSASTENFLACWVIVTENQHFVYASDTGSGVISGFELEPSGRLSILNTASATTGSGSTPMDLALGGNSRFLFSVNPANGPVAGTITGWRIDANGSLVSTGSVTGIPASAQGLAAR
ncbi:MAG: beta-propeller fold lactonase family protein, partial [Acidobacteriaceae bacterium]